MESLKYIQNYQLSFRKVVKEAKRREADRFILPAKNKNKALWKLVNREIGKSHRVANITINTGVKRISNPQIITERFNAYFTGIIEDMLAQVNSYNPQQYANFQIKNCSGNYVYSPCHRNRGGKNS